jgi:hypothetical protein
MQLEMFAPTPHATSRARAERLARREAHPHRRLLLEIRATMAPGCPGGAWTIMDWHDELGCSYERVRALLMEAGVPERSWG